MGPGIDTRRVARWLPPFTLAALFLVTRLAFLDRDLPPWELAWYQPLDESAYTIPAFHLHRFGTWTNQDVPWVPLEGSPTNVLQSLVTTATLALDWSYWGFRMSSVLFGLVAFLALLAVARTILDGARADGARPLLPAAAILAGTAALLLADFGFLLGGRVVEATIPRLASLAVLFWLVARGSLLGAGHGLARSGLLGAAAAALATFGYLYNAFLLPGVLLAILGWGWGRMPRHTLAVHLAAAGAGMIVAVGAYFAWVYAVYGTLPLEWYALWLSRFREAGRATEVNPAALWDLLTANSFRLDRTLLALTLLALPVFAWWTKRSRSPLGVIVLACLAAFAAQTMVQSDYPARKMLVLLAFTVPVAVTGLARGNAFLDEVGASRRRTILVTLWTVVVLAGTAIVLVGPDLLPWKPFVQGLGMPTPVEMAYSVGGFGPLHVAATAAGVAALLALVVRRHHPRAALTAGAVLALAMLVPLVALDVRHVYTRVTSAYRDTMAGIADLPDAAVIAGEHAHALLLYNDAEAVLQGYVYGMTVTEYEAAVRRYFAEGRARWMFADADDAGLARWGALGFRLVEAYPIELPKGRVLGRYELIGP